MKTENNINLFGNTNTVATSMFDLHFHRSCVVSCCAHVSVSVCAYSHLETHSFWVVQSMLQIETLPCIGILIAAMASIYFILFLLDYGAVLFASSSPSTARTTSASSLRLKSRPMQSMQDSWNRNRNGPRWLSGG